MILVISIFRCHWETVNRVLSNRIKSSTLKWWWVDHCRFQYIHCIHYRWLRLPQKWGIMYMTLNSIWWFLFSSEYLRSLSTSSLSLLTGPVSVSANTCYGHLTKALTAIDKLSVIWKSDLTDKMKRCFFQAALASILLCGSTTWTLRKRIEKKLDGNYTRMLRAILNKSWRQHSAKHQLYGHLPPITKTKLDEPGTQDTAGGAGSSS